MSIPALTRGLLIMEGFIKDPQPQRYKQIKEMISGITDASLSRLIQSLTDDNYIEKNGEGTYQLANKVKKWGSYLVKQKDWNSLMQNTIDSITEELGESAAIGILEDDKIVIKRSKSIPDSISIMNENSILHFEPDHAGALSVLETLTITQRKKIIKSNYSKIKSYHELEKSLKQFKQQNVFADTSSHRKGISRVGVPIVINELPATLFISTLASNIKDRLPLYQKTLAKFQLEFTAGNTN